MKIRRKLGYELELTKVLNRKMRRMKRKLRRGMKIRGKKIRRRRCSGRMEGEMDRGAEVKEKEEDVERRGERVKETLCQKNFPTKGQKGNV